MEDIRNVFHNKTKMWHDMLWETLVLVSFYKANQVKAKCDHDTSI
jgi:hypothetical protein